MWPPAVPLDPQELRRRRLLSAVVGPQPLTPWPTSMLSTSLPTRASSCGIMVHGNSLPIQQFRPGNSLPIQKLGPCNYGGPGSERDGTNLPDQQLGGRNSGSAVVVNQAPGLLRGSLALPSRVTTVKLPEESRAVDRSRTPRRPGSKAEKRGGRRHLCEVCSILCLTDDECSDSDSSSDESSSSDEE